MVVMSRMRGRSLQLVTLFLLLAPSFSDAQMSGTMSGTASNTGMPSATDTAPGQNNGAPVDASSLVNYYFVFLAVFIGIAGMGGFFIYKRRQRAMMAMRNSRENALARDISNFERTRTRWYRQGRWGRSEEDVGREEEGLNEFGEAPPAYAPKTSEERAREQEHGPAVPLQTLSREHAGLKPPDYAEAAMHPIERPGRSSTASAASSSRQPDVQHANVEGQRDDSET